MYTKSPLFKKTTHIRLMTAILMGSSMLFLAGCQTTSTTPSATAQIDSALQNAANQADAAGHAKESLSIVEKLYKRNPNDADIAVRYARALRQADRLSRASIVIAPFAKDTRKPNAAARTEFSTIQVSLGNYATGEDYARKALAMDDTSSDAWHMLGIALDSQGNHPEAETAFRKALELSHGDATPILNNLGLNLAAQGFLDEAAETLRKALATSPNRGEIERNLRIVSALRESGGRAPSYLQAARDKKNATQNATMGTVTTLETAEKSAPEGAVSQVPVPGQKPVGPMGNN